MREPMYVDNVFYNANYNEGSPCGQSKFCWGVSTLDLNNDIQSQILPNRNDVYNFNLTCLNILRVDNSKGS